MTPSHRTGTAASDDETATSDLTSYALTLFVSGASDLSASAIAKARELCDTHLGRRYLLSVVDMNDDPDSAVRSGVVAAPTLVRNLPLPVRKIVGDLSNGERVIQALEFPMAASGSGGNEVIARPARRVGN